MKRSARRTSAVVLLAGAGMLIGCSSSASTASRDSQDTYVVRTADGRFVVGDSLGMQMKAEHDQVFAMALSDSYRDFNAEPSLKPQLPARSATSLADHPGD